MTVDEAISELQTIKEKEGGNLIVIADYYDEMRDCQVDGLVRAFDVEKLQDGHQIVRIHYG